MLLINFSNLKNDTSSNDFSIPERFRFCSVVVFFSVILSFLIYSFGPGVRAPSFIFPMGEDIRVAILQAFCIINFLFVLSMSRLKNFFRVEIHFFIPSFFIRASRSGPIFYLPHGGRHFGGDTSSVLHNKFPFRSFYVPVEKFLSGGNSFFLFLTFPPLPSFTFGSSPFDSFLSLYSLIPILNFALLDLGFSLISFSSGSIGFLVSCLNGIIFFPNMSPSFSPKTDPVFIKFFTILSSRE